MQLTHKGKVYVLIILASLLFAVCTITFRFFPHFGMALAFIVFTLLAYYIKKDKTPAAKTFFAITLALAGFLAIRSEGLLTFLNVVGVVYFGSLFLETKGGENQRNVMTIIFAPLNLIVKSFFSATDYRLDFKDTGSEEKKEENTLNAVAIGLTTIASLAIILPLLASTNPFFNNLVLGVLDFFGLKDFQVTENLFQWIYRLIVFLGLAFIVPKMATVVNSKQNSSASSTEGLNMLVPKIVVSSVLIIFFITQLQLYFSSPATLADLGYTLSRYTNEVFAQLSAVAAIVLILLFGEKVNKKANNKMTLILAIQGIFLTFMAYKSVYEYSAAWGFTYKRLYGFAVATWILGIFIIYLNSFLRGVAKGVFLVRSLIYTGIILTLINIANFDYLIYHFRRASTGQGVDHEYLTRLSSDSLSYKDQLNELVKDPAGTPTEEDKQAASNNGLLILLFKIDRLQEKFKAPDIRGFNLLEYLQYKEIKDVDTQVIRSKYNPAYPI